MNAAQIHAKIYAGRAKAALRLGLVYNVYRPIQATDPLSNQILSINAAFNAGDSTYKSPNLPGDPIWYGDFDGRLTKPGDYLIHSENPTDIKYIAAQQQLLPIICIDCNRSIRIARATPLGAVGAVGALGYSGIADTSAESSDVLGVNPLNNNGTFIGWPCSMIFGKGRLRNSEALPSGTSEQMGWMVYLPISVPIVVGAGDRLIDDLGRMFVVNGAEQSDIGWRINAIEMHP